VLHVVHGYPPWSRAGTEIYAERLAVHQAAFREVLVHARVGGSGARHGASVDQADPDRSLVVRAVANDFTARNPLARNAIRDPVMAADLGSTLDRFAPELVHLHHLAGHGLSAATEVSRRRIPLVIQVQDWWFLCARANLLDGDRRLCPGPRPDRCAVCLPLTRVVPSRGWSALLYRARAAAARRALALADVLVMGSQAIRSSYQALGWLPTDVRTEVLDYGTPTAAPRPRLPWNKSRPLRLGFVGSILPHKGLHLALAALAGLDPGHVELEIWGDPTADPAYHRELLGLAGPNVRWSGRFEEDRRDDVFARFDLMVVPSLGLESYGLLVREAFARGIPVLASDRGALPEAFPRPAPGRVLPAEDAGAWRQALLQVLEQPEVLERWRAAIPAQTAAHDHAEAIEQLYRDVLARRSR
jgi:glycosyltransferase involved in cell wall biosynthesis